MMIVFFLSLLPSCQRELEYREASQIVDRKYSHERFENGQLKWELLEVLGPDGPYTDVVNDDFRGSGGSLSVGQLGTFTVSNGSGSISKEYGGVEGTAFMAIPVQTRNMQNAVIVCRTVSVLNADAKQDVSGTDDRVIR